MGGASFCFSKRTGRQGGTCVGCFKRVFQTAVKTTVRTGVKTTIDTNVKTCVLFGKGAAPPNSALWPGKDTKTNT